MRCLECGKRINNKSDCVVIVFGDNQRTDMHKQCLKEAQNEMQERETEEGRQEDSNPSSNSGASSRSSP